MTLTLVTAAKGVQALGMLGAVLGVVLVWLAPICASSIWATTGVVAVVLDAAALATRSGSGAAIPLALLKLLVVTSSIMVIVSCAYVAEQPRLFPPDLGPNLLLASILPSVVGAFMVRFAR